MPRIPIPVDPGSLNPVVGAMVSDSMRDRHNCGVHPDLGSGGFFGPFDTHSLLIGDGKVLNGTQGQELVTKGCKTMIPDRPRKLYVPTAERFVFCLAWGATDFGGGNSTKKPGENGVSASMCIKSPEQDKSRPGNMLRVALKPPTKELRYKVYITHPIRGSIGEVEASREDCEKNLKQVLTECSFLGAGGYVLEMKDNKEHLYYGLSVSECDGDLPIV